MKTIVKIGISAISAAAVAGVGYLGKKAYDKKKAKDTSNASESKADTTNTEVSKENAN